MYTKMNIKSIEWDKSSRKKVRIGPSFIPAAKDVVGGSNGYSGKFGDEEASMLWLDGKEAANFKKNSTGVANNSYEHYCTYNYDCNYSSYHYMLSAVEIYTGMIQNSSCPGKIFIRFI